MNIKDVDFIPFLESDVDYLLIIGPRFSGRSFLAERLREDYLKVNPSIEEYQHIYMNFYQYGADVISEAYLSDLGNYKEYDYSSSMNPIPLIFLDMLDDLNEYEIKCLKQYMYYPPRNNKDRRFKLVITATKETVKKLQLDIHEHATIELDEHNYLLDALHYSKEVNGITYHSDDINEMMLEHLYSYKEISKETIDIINAAIIFGHGLISEYSFKSLFKKGFNIRLTEQEMLRYLHYNRIIYSYMNDEDVARYQRFIWFKHQTFLDFLKEQLKDEIKKIGCYFYDVLKDFDFTNTLDMMSPVLRMMGLFKYDAIAIYDVLMHQTDAYLGLENYDVEYEGKKYRVNKFFSDALKEEILYDPSFDEKFLTMVELSTNDEKEMPRFLKIVVDEVLKMYLETFNSEKMVELVQKTYFTYTNLKEYKYLNDTEFFKQFSFIARMMYKSYHKEEMLNYYIDTLKKSIKKDDGSREFYISLLEAVTELKEVKEEEALPYIRQYFTFKNESEMYNFAIRTYHIVSYLSKVEAIAVVLDKA